MKGTLLISIAMLFLFSCTVKQVTAPETERIFKDAEIRSSSGDNLPLEDIVTLEKRVKTYWDARMAGNHAIMYKLEDPDVIEKQKLTLTGYTQSKSPAIIDKAYQVKGLEIVNPEKVRVYIILDAFINIPQVMKDEKAVIRDIWQKKQGQWYRWLVLNPFSVLNENDRKNIEAEPYRGVPGEFMPAGSGTKIEESPVQPESGVKIEITPNKLGGVEVVPVPKEIPGKDSKEEK